MNKTQLPNCLTLLRMAGSVILCLVPVFSAGFYGVYLLCGVTDMLDGALARRLQAESRTGEVPDSLADAFFVLVCLVRLLPHLRLPGWLWIWVGLIALIKLLTLAVGAFRDHCFAFLHTAPATGLWSAPLISRTFPTRTGKWRLAMVWAMGSGTTAI